MRVAPKSVAIRLYRKEDLSGILPRLESFVRSCGVLSLSQDPGMLSVLDRGLHHEPYALVAHRETDIEGCLLLALVKSSIFGSFLVSLPYVNTGGIVCAEEGIGSRLIDAAVGLANQLRVRYLELRHEKEVQHLALNLTSSAKVHMRLALPDTSAKLWDSLHSKVRNQIRKAQKIKLSTCWGGEDLLPEFYDVFSRNMRDLGTPVYGKSLFRSLLKQFGDRTEVCVVRQERRPVASALCLHGLGVSEVPSASSLREYNHTNANMLLYWNLLQRAIELGQATFDFGRSSRDSNTYRFKKQWGAVEVPAAWQYYVRKGNISEMRPDSPRYQVLIRCWQQMPVALTRIVGPMIVRGIP